MHNETAVQEFIDNRLTERERQVVKLLIDNKTSGEIAQALNIKRSTVSAHRDSIGEKMISAGLTWSKVITVKK